MTFDKDAELDPQLSGIALAALYARYEQQFEGYTLTKMMKQHSQAEGDAKIAGRINKALKAAFADLEALVAAVPSEGPEQVPETATNDKLLLEIYWRLHDGWKAETAPALQLIRVEGATPVWSDIEALFGELAAIDHDGGDGDSFPSEWYDDLLTRHEAAVAKTKAKAKKAAARKAAPIKEPPPGADIVDYSPKETFNVGQWVRHPKFGIGLVVESGQHVALEFPEGRKMLAHVAPVATAMMSSKPRSQRSAIDTLELARAAGVEVKKVPPRPDEEK